MKAFGSTLDRAGSSMGSLMDSQASALWRTKKRNFWGDLNNTFTKAVSIGIKKAGKSLGSANGISASEKIPYSTDPDPTIDYKNEDNFNILNNAGIPSSSEVYHNTINKKLEKVKTEDTSRWDQGIIDQMNWYNFSGGTALNSYDQFEGEEGKELKRYAEAQRVVHSLFNPYYGLEPNYLGPNQPIAALAKWTTSSLYDLDNCTIENLVSLSRRHASILGQARYKYADFMFCKELGMPNNHLITLRRYSSPVGDMIHGKESVDTEYSISTYNKTEYKVKTTSSKDGTTSTRDKGTSTGSKKVVSYKNTVQLADVGHLCCYFGGEDNKLEDILKYSFKQTYKQMNSKIQRLDSKEDDRQSPLGALINSTSKGYSKHMLNSTAGNNNILKWGAQSGTFGTGIRKLFGGQSWYHNNEAMYHVDQNKIYEPKNTIQEIDYYEGKLQFSHEFSIVFSYKLRAYDNISPKAAMLDLIANITKTCYTAGSFWGGARQINGPQPNPTAWNKANSFIDKTWDKLGSGLATLLSGGYDMQSILGSISQFASEMMGKAMELAKNIGNSVKDGTAGKKLVSAFKSFNSKYGISDQLKGALKDTMGRPQMYAFDSLLSGGDTGMWHLTIGNPLRPIITIGNLEVTNTEIQHLGPLGIDDFPTELKVTVSFKHARPRDAVSIEKMYVFGGKSIYKKHLRANPGKIYNIFNMNTSAHWDSTSKLSEKQQKEQFLFGNDGTPDIMPVTPKEEEKKTTTKPAGGTPKNTPGKGGNNGNNGNNQDSSNQVTTEESTQTLYKFDSTQDIKMGGDVKNDVYLITNGLEYIGEFDFDRMKANMDELA